MIRCVISDQTDKLLKIINEPIGKLCKSLCGKVIFEKINDRNYLIYEIKDSYYDYFSKQLTNTMTKFLLYSVKDEFYRESLPFKFDNIYAYVILKSLVFADFEITREKLENSIGNFDEFCLDGVKNFMLTKEFAEWKNIARATNDNSYVLTHKKEYKKFLSCIVSNVVGKDESLYLLGEDEPFLVTDDLKKVTYSLYDGDKMTQNQLFVSNLIEHLPSKLLIYNKNLSKEIISVIDLLFDSNLSMKKP
ncbi:MAG: hypothetical protein RR107_06825 [Clostridia bacterium]